MKARMSSGGRVDAGEERKITNDYYHDVKGNPWRAERENGSTSKANSGCLSVALWNATWRNNLRLSHGKKIVL